MNRRKMIIRWGVAAVCTCVLSLFASCSSLHKSAKSVSLSEVQLSPEMSRKYDYYFMEAVRLKQKGDYDAAFEMYLHCLDINPHGAASLYEISQFYLYLRQLDKGEKVMKQAVQADSSNFWYNQTLAAFYQNKGNTEKAIATYEDMVRLFPSKVEPLMALIDLYNRKKDYSSVIKTLNRMENKEGKSEQISMEKFRMYLAMDSVTKAFTEIENLVKEYPFDMRYRTILGDVYMGNGREDEAFEIFQHVLKEQPMYAPAMLSLANYYEKTGQDSLYRQQIDGVLLNGEVQTETKMNIMRQIILRSEQTDKDSIKIAGLFQSILKQKQEDAQLAMLAAQYLLTKKMNKEATPVLHQVLDIDPENTPARLQLLQFALREENLDKIITICTPALEYTPEVMEFYYYKGLAHYQKDEKDEALKVFSKGVKQIDEESDKMLASDFYAIMGDIYHQKKMNKEAYAAYDSALVYKADNIGALNNYAYYLSVEKVQLDKAEEMSYRTVKAEPTNSTYLDTYAWILFEKGKFTEAKIYITQAIKNGGDGSSVVIEHAGDIYYMNGDKKKALEFWIKAEEVSKKEAEDENEEAARTPEELKLLRKKIASKRYLKK